MTVYNSIIKDDHCRSKFGVLTLDVGIALNEEALCAEEVTKVKSNGVKSGRGGQMPRAGDEVCEAGEQGEGRALCQKGREALPQQKDSGGTENILGKSSSPLNLFSGAQSSGADGPW